jgi:hypothetical protein
MFGPTVSLLPPSGVVVGVALAVDFTSVSWVATGLLLGEVCD